MLEKKRRVIHAIYWPLVLLLTRQEQNASVLKRPADDGSELGMAMGPRSPYIRGEFIYYRMGMGNVDPRHVKRGWGLKGLLIPVPRHAPLYSLRSPLVCVLGK